MSRHVSRGMRECPGMYYLQCDMTGHVMISHEGKASPYNLYLFLSSV
ncbi:hypothetical protein LAh8_62 [Aeromonas phage LAh_8]|uniref:Uncharacterized protein n=2 Tax=Lahexavirus TaxID=2843411 RepID=A0A514A019_9CAUD|nr:hypothetical protein HWC30_gp003 [Aeromonas phage LAh_6]YP_009847400.1 hypothetical protein HWC31_gp062 [Aeromonas phage LAh_8]QDH46628.1 hypothetical protein LAh6_3 [Aeromonas phage LAh_6]QDH46855.1 hypothetical protein LAh8_62 [Aeromonas phage LAh_8]